MPTQGLCKTCSNECGMGCEIVCCKDYMPISKANLKPIQSTDGSNTGFKHTSQAQRSYSPPPKRTGTYLNALDED